MKSVFSNSIILGFSIIISLVLGEFMFRAVLDPVDYLLPKIVFDPVLNHRVDPGSGGHDSWGFRNTERPRTSSIVAIGDSMTYGISADSKHSWPALLARKLGKPVYNMGLGGYGPVHYYSLLKDKAVLLKPKMVIIGFYFGNDLMDTYNIVYSNDNWKHLRKHITRETLDARGFVPAAAPKKRLFGDLRSWFSRNSILYRIVTSLKIFDFIRNREFSSRVKNVITLDVNRIPLLFNPAQRLSLLALDDPRLSEGLETAKSIFTDIKSFTDERGIRLVVLLIPTKEQVYLNQLKAASLAPPDSALARLSGFETQTRNIMSAFFKSNDIEVIDLLPSLAKAARKEALYPFNDGHPNAKGYAVIARVIYTRVMKK